MKTTTATSFVDWADLEEFLKLHDEENIFMDGRPQGLKECIHKLQLFYGMSLATTAKNARKGISRCSKRGTRMVQSTTPFALACQEDIVNDAKMPYNAAAVDALNHYSSAKPKQQQKLTIGGDTAEILSPILLQDNPTSAKLLTSLQILKDMRICLISEEPKLLFKYIGMVIRCSKFLNQFHHSTQQIHGENNTCKKHETLELVYSALKISYHGELYCSKLNENTRAAILKRCCLAGVRI
ncbi:hypothetical protein BT63DRAFT_146169 [Microthyrium microscopicum]|uniref:Uncharacterized protein n=1 Tax=Microthyrium microscopicum TaxID=703497 RepID=A0A6A6UNU0_9PEZI|nr:hypothetical protein BT63DRAFT_146169 [Microthyrium microscopicum]